MSDSQELDARFGDSAARALRAQHPGQATQVEQARAIAEVRAAVMIAMDRPRDRTAAIAEMREVCSIQSLAERAFFRVPRAGSMVNGETIHLARELARCWGNIDYGVKELARDDIRGQSELLAFAWDLQTNARSEITFIIPHVRGRGNNRLTGTQEIYENNASFAGRRLREAIFAVLPVWFKAEAAEICHNTLANGGAKTLIQRVTDLRLAFEDQYGISAKQLEKKRGRRIDEFLPEDVAALRVIFGSLKRGEITIAEEFPSEEQDAPRHVGSKLDALEAAAAASPHSPAGDDGNRADQPKPTGRAALDGEKQPPAGGDLLAPAAKEPRPGACRVPLPDKPTAMHWQEWAWGIDQKLQSYPPAAVLRDNRDNLEIFAQVDEMRHDALMTKLGADNG